MEAAIKNLEAEIAKAGPTARDQALHALNRALASIEVPIDALNNLAAVQTRSAVATIADEMGLYKALAGKDYATSDELAKELGAGPVFTNRILQYLNAIGHVSEVGDESFAPNEKTKAFAEEQWTGGIHHYHKLVAPAIQKFPELAKKHNYQDVSDPADTAMNLAWDIKVPAFEWLPTQPHFMKWFSDFMTVQRVGYAQWTSVFPVEKEVGNWKGEVLFVDVGAAFGGQAINFHKAFPNLPGKIIVQDQAPVIADLQLPEPLEKMPIDFFKGQPVKGAKFYYMRNIMHDWPDEKATIILKHLVDAMGPESEILIDEMWIPARDTPMLAAQNNILMNSCLAAIERNEQQWKTLLDGAGLKIKASYKYTTSLADTVMIAVKK